MNYINLTAHEIKDEVTGLTIKPSGIRIRVDNPSISAGDMDGIPLYKDNPSAQVRGLPGAKKGTIYIVSSLVLNYVPKHRTDVMSVGSPLRDRDTGKVIACKGFRINE